MVGGKRDFPPAFRSGIACRNSRLDLLWLKEYLSLPRAERTPGREIAREVWRAVTFRERADTLTRYDPMPGLVDAGRILGRLRRNLGKLGRLATRSEPVT